MTAPNVPLGDVVQSRTGIFDPRTASSAEFTYVDIAAVDSELKCISSARKLPVAEAPSRARKLIRAGDVLVSTVRPNLNAVAMVPADLDGQVASTGFCVLRASERVLPRYIFFFARSPTFVAELTALVSGALYPAVSDSQVLSQRLPLPNLREQERQVDVLSRAEGILRLRREAQRKAAELIPALFLDRFGDPARNPKSWPSARLGELVTLQGGGTPSKSRPELWAGSLPWVTPKDMKSNAVWDSIDHVSDLALDQSAVRLIPRDSILIVVRGMILVHTVPIAQAKVELTVNQDMKALLVRDGIDLNTQYLSWCLRALHDNILARVTSAAHGTRKLETPRLLDLEVPLPGLHEQHAFAAETIRVMEIQGAQSEAQLRAQATFDALLHQAFAR